MNRLQRARNNESSSSLENYGSEFKYSSKQKKQGSRTRLSGIVLPLLVALLIGSAFFVASVSGWPLELTAAGALSSAWQECKPGTCACPQTITAKLPTARFPALPDLDQQRVTRVRGRRN